MGTSFSCANVPFQPGMYTDIDSGCQVYRVCNDGRDGPQGAGFLCPNGTLFNQQTFECDHWFKVDCKAQAAFYELNLDPYHNPFVHAEKNILTTLMLLIMIPIIPPLIMLLPIIPHLITFPMLPHITRLLFITLPLLTKKAVL